MPRYRPRKQALNFISSINEQRKVKALQRRLKKYNILSDDSSSSNGLSSDSENMFEDVLDYLMLDLEYQIKISQYLFRGKYRNRNFFDWEDAVSNNSKRFNDDEFLHEFRMQRESFHKLTELLKDDDNFKNINGKKKKGNINQHLLVFLKRVGLEGTSGSASSIATFFGIGQGTVRNYVIRTTKALLNLKEEVICWPDGKEKESLKLRIKISSGFQKCIGIIDGTLIFLHERPKKYGDSYYCRKGRYAVNVQVICDDNRKITYYYGGWPGSTHDNRAWQNCKVFCNRQDYFSNGEYLLGDSAYSSCSVIIQSFKKSPGTGSLDKYKQFFNERLAKPRVTSEHCIGILKNRFPCLKCSNVSINGKRGVQKLMRIFGACAVLHNLLIDVEDDIPEAWYKEVDSGHYWTEDNYAGNANYEDRYRRDAVFNAIIEDYYH